MIRNEALNAYIRAIVARTLRIKEAREREAIRKRKRVDSERKRVDSERDTQKLRDMAARMGVCVKPRERKVTGLL